MADDEASIEWLVADLAHGDGRAREFDGTGLRIARICSSDDPLFGAAYEKLWAEFGAEHTMEPRDLIARRLAWHPAGEIDGCWLRYEMILVQREEKFVAVRDHTAVVTASSGSAQAVVHLSHVLVDPEWRRAGLAGWLRAWPLQTARACLVAAGFSIESPVTLVAEMEHPDSEHQGRLIRLKAYEKAGFKKIDPGAVKYFQPDFRLPAAIDESGGPRPLPFGLVLRRVGREPETAIRGGEVRDVVTCLYRMYGVGFRSTDMAAVWETLRDYPADDAEVALVPPTQ